MISSPESNIRPFRLFGNVYFVGGREVSVHVIDTGEGLIMIDTGYPNMRDRVLENMRLLGLDIRDLRIILHSHGHIDHIGSTSFYKGLSAAQTAISRIDNDIVNGTLDLSWARELNLDPVPPFDCDILLDDHSEICLGDTTISCRLAPGHTAGTFALFFDAHDERGRVMRCAMHGGVGTNSMTREFLSRYGLSVRCREHFREGLHELSRENVDIVLGNHPDQNDTEGKLARLLAGEVDAFIDPGEWRRFLKSCEARLDRMLEDEKI